MCVVKVYTEVRVGVMWCSERRRVAHDSLSREMGAMQKLASNVVGSYC